MFLFKFVFCQSAGTIVKHAAIAIIPQLDTGKESCRHAIEIRQVSRHCLTADGMQTGYLGSLGQRPKRELEGFQPSFSKVIQNPLICTICLEKVVPSKLSCLSCSPTAVVGSRDLWGRAHVAQNVFLAV